MTVNQILADNRKMEQFICDRLPADATTRIVLADGGDGPAWVNLTPLWDDDGDCDLVIETNEPDALGVREVYEHFRRLDRTSWEREREIQGELIKYKVLSLAKEIESLRGGKEEHRAGSPTATSTDWNDEEETAADIPRLDEPTASLKQRRGQEPMEENQIKLLRLVQCVRVSGHSSSTLRRAIKDGRLKAHSIGRGRKRPTYGIKRSDLEAYIEASRFQTPDSPRIPIIGIRKKSRHFD